MFGFKKKTNTAVKPLSRAEQSFKIAAEVNERTFDSLLETIDKETALGKFTKVFDFISPENQNKLKDLGYKVRPYGYTNVEVSWYVGS